MKRVAIVFMIAAAAVLPRSEAPAVELLPAVVLEGEASQNPFGRMLCLDPYNGWCPESNRPTPIPFEG